MKIEPQGKTWGLNRTKIYIWVGFSAKSLTTGSLFKVNVNLLEQLTDDFPHTDSKALSDTLDWLIDCCHILLSFHLSVSKRGVTAEEKDKHTVSKLVQRCKVFSGLFFWVARKIENNVKANMVHAPHTLHRSLTDSNTSKATWAATVLHPWIKPGETQLLTALTCNSLLIHYTGLPSFQIFGVSYTDLHIIHISFYFAAARLALNCLHSLLLLPVGAIHWLVFFKDCIQRGIPEECYEA